MRTAFLFSALTCTAFFAVVSAQQPALKLSATSVNVNEPGTVVRIDLNRWSGDQERQQLLAAMNPPAPASTAPTDQARGGDTGRGGGRGGGARGGAQAGRGGAQAGRGGRGRGGGGGGGAAAFDPIVSLTNAFGRAPTLGYIWTNEVTGYSIKYAWRTSLPDGGERIILVTNRRIGAHTLSWEPANGTPTPYEFTLLEIRLNSKGAGEAKASLTAPVAIDSENKTLQLENYAAAVTLLQNIKHR